MNQRRLLLARYAVLAAAALAVLIGLAFLGTMPGRGPSPSRSPATAAASSPLLRAPASPSPLPMVEPLVVAEMTRDRAREINAAVRFVDAPNPPAKPFRFVGSPADHERALTCLAAAAWYEAGDDVTGRQAVAQVVINRARHPAFPKSICGVVFEGAQRSSGCQFTFTCDGALGRTPSEAAWRRARGVAQNALTGFVYKPVGTATHYHTDWVVPFWSASLDKIAAVDTHLFFRWRGWWGQLPAFSGRVRGPEALDPRIERLAAPIGRTDPKLAVLPFGVEDAAQAAPPGRGLQVDGVSEAALRGSSVRLKDDAKADYVLQLAPGTFPGSYALTALALCSGKPVCQVMGWLKREMIPAALPVAASGLRSMTFLYRRNASLDREQLMWNCRQVPREDPAECLPGTGAP